MKTLNVLVILSAVIFTVFLASCSKNEKPAEQKETKAAPNELSGKGKELFYEVSKKTGLKCADCHFDGGDSASMLVRTNADIFNANKRKYVYNGMFSGDDVAKNAGGASYCWKKYIGDETPLTQEQISSLNAYYEFTGKNKPITEFKLTTIAVPKPDKEKLKEDQTAIASLTGDKTKGQDLFKQFCSSCHRKDSPVKDVPNIANNKDVNLKAIAYHIRLGSKHMPFFPYEAISNQGIADLAAFLLNK